MIRIRKQERRKCHNKKARNKIMIQVGKTKKYTSKKEKRRKCCKQDSKKEENATSKK